jgi:hypothetical protein
MSYCKVSYCRFSNTHVTKGHKCGPCGQYGHGEIECTSPYYKSLLQQYNNDILPNNIQCTISDCLFKEYHTIEAHHCPQCNKREPHTIVNCSQKDFNIKCPICRTENTIKDPKKILGLSDKCSICLDNNVEIVFPSCNHCCICMECLKKL